MAIEVTDYLVEKTGVTLPTAYIHLHRLETSRNNVKLLFGVYTSKEIKDNAGRPHEWLDFTLNDYIEHIPDGLDEDGNVIEQGQEGQEGWQTWFSAKELDKKGVNPIVQAYKFLMSKEEFQNGTAN